MFSLTLEELYAFRNLLVKVQKNVSKTYELSPKQQSEYHWHIVNPILFEMKACSFYEGGTSFEFKSKAVADTLFSRVNSIIHEKELQTSILESQSKMHRYTIINVITSSIAMLAAIVSAVCTTIVSCSR